MKPVLALVVAVNRLLTRAFPRRFRIRHAGALIDSSSDLLHREYGRHGLIGLAAATGRVWRDLFVAGIAERVGSQGPSLPRTGSSMIDSLVQDLRFAIRSMALRPAWTVLAAATLAIGIGASAAMFSVVDAVVLKPMSFPEPDRLVAVSTTMPVWLESEQLAEWWDRGLWDYDEFGAWSERQSSFENAALVAMSRGNLTGRGPAQRLRIGRATHELLDVLGAVPQAGRFLTPDDSRLQAPVVVLSSEFWRRGFAADPEVVGSTLRLQGRDHVVVGVLPPGFLLDGFDAEAWVPIDGPGNAEFPSRNVGDALHVFHAIGRLAEGVTAAAAEQETGRLLEALHSEDHMGLHGARVVGWLTDSLENSRGPLVMLMGAVLLMLLVACANVATFLLGRAIDRREEIAVRSAVGASRGRLARQLLIESLVLAAVGCALGLVLASAGVAGLTALAPADVPRIEQTTLDVRAVGFATTIAALSGILFGLAPAVSLLAADLSSPLRAARSGDRSRGRLQSALVVVEVTVATVLMVGAGLLARSFVHASRVDPGFDAERVLSVALSPPRFEHLDDDGNHDAPALAQRYHALADELRALPGIVAVSATHALPYTAQRGNNAIQPVGVVLDEGDFQLGERRFVWPGYLELMRIPLLEGRTLRPEDNSPDAESVVVITRTMAERFWPNDSAVGKSLRWWDQESRIVGVVGDVRDRDLTRDPGLRYYAAESRFGRAGGTLVLRTEAPPAQVADTVRRAIERFDPNLPVESIVPLQDRVDESMAAARYRTRLITVFAAVAALLCVLGLYGVVSRAVNARTRELGIRLALGAYDRQVLTLVLGDGVRLAAVGTALGIVISLLVTRALTGLLYRVAPDDPITFIGIVATVGALACLACLAPSLRASRIDPITTLRG